MIFLVLVLVAPASAPTWSSTSWQIHPTKGVECNMFPTGEITCMQSFEDLTW